MYLGTAKRGVVRCFFRRLNFRPNRFGGGIRVGSRLFCWLFFLNGFYRGSENAFDINLYRIPLRFYLILALCGEKLLDRLLQYGEFDLVTIRPFGFQFLVCLLLGVLQQLCGIYFFHFYISFHKHSCMV